MPPISVLSPEAISRLLFETDPMHTCCRENDCVDEYDRVARDLADRLAVGAEPARALRQVLGEWFDAERVAQASLQATHEVFGAALRDTQRRQ
ncbi:hypothetical protein [Billgrantia desiderata]|uniref:hypothetical protein n=1 Tax=Billgrantia desiderata TaxID=52021 RepID=UPI00174BC7E0